MTDPTTSGEREIVVVGGGQAGLAIGYFLKQQGATSRSSRPRRAGGGVAARWDSLRLFTPVRVRQPARARVPGDPDATRAATTSSPTSPTTRAFELPLELDSAVRAVAGRTRRLLVELDDRTYAAEQVVIATGPSRCRACRRSPSAWTRASCSCHSTATAARAAPGGRCSSSAAATRAFRSPRSSPAARGAPVDRSRQTPLPQRIAGRDLFDYLQRHRLMRVTVDLAARQPLAATARR
jgi:putative flavoprotein involved in K+ transport